MALRGKRYGRGGLGIRERCIVIDSFEFAG